MITVQLQRSYVIPLNGTERMEVVPIHAQADVMVQVTGNVPCTLVCGYSLTCVCSDGQMRLLPARVLREHILTIPKMAPKGTLGTIDTPKRIEVNLAAPTTAHDTTQSTPAPDKP